VSLPKPMLIPFRKNIIPEKYHSISFSGKQRCFISGKWIFRKIITELFRKTNIKWFFVPFRKINIVKCFSGKRIKYYFFPWEIIFDVFILLGTHRVRKALKEMVGFYPLSCFNILWKYTAPLSALVIFFKHPSPFFESFLDPLRLLSCNVRTFALPYWKELSLLGRSFWLLPFCVFHGCYPWLCSLLYFP